MPTRSAAVRIVLLACFNALPGLGGVLTLAGMTYLVFGLIGAWGDRRRCGRPLRCADRHGHRPAPCCRHGAVDGDRRRPVRVHVQWDCLIRHIRAILRARMLGAGERRLHAHLRQRLPARDRLQQLRRRRVRPRDVCDPSAEQRVAVSDADRLPGLLRQRRARPPVELRHGDDRGVRLSQTGGRGAQGRGG